VAQSYEIVPVPRVSANDDSGLLVEWRKANADAVTEGDVLCEIEFSKSVVEVMVPRNGYLFCLHEVGDEVAVGKPLAVVSETIQRPNLESAGGSNASDIKITTKAQTLIDQNSLDSAVFAGHAIVKEKHVLAYLEQAAVSDGTSAEGEFTPLSAVQRRVAQTLAESMRTIPHSQVTRWLRASRVDEATEKLCSKHEQMISLSDRLVAAVAQSLRDLPAANASWHEKGILEHSHVSVGFAMNQANGDLLVPVIHNADTRPLTDIVAQIRDYQKKALRRKLKPEDLTGGTITVTSLVGTGAHYVSPIILPPQAVIVALGDYRDQGNSSDYALTVAFDHRILNGTEAAALATAVGNELEENTDHD